MFEPPRCKEALHSNAIQTAKGFVAALSFHAARDRGQNEMRVCPHWYRMLLKCRRRMNARNLTIKDIPRNFMSETGQTLADYSVALGISREVKGEKFKPIGSGVLVRRDNKFGILTAQHCVCAPGPNLSLGPTGTDTLFIVLKRGRGVLIPPQQLIKHPLTVPKSLEYGPDLAFVEVLAGECLNSIKAVSSFWSLDKDPISVKQNFGKIGMLLATIGFPGVHYDTEIDGNTIRHQIRHMAYYFINGPGDVVENDGWDYIENQCDYSPSTELPKSFEGMSGGPVWGLHFEVDEAKEEFRLTDFALVGITFYQTAVENEQRKLRAHYVRSIYDIAWGSFSAQNNLLTS